MFEELTDLEKEKIILFNEDLVLVEAIRKVILASIYTNGTLRKDVKADPLKNAALGLVSLAGSGGAIISDEVLGQDLRGFYMGIQLLESGFKKLSQLKKVVPGEENKTNEAL